MCVLIITTQSLFSYNRSPLIVDNISCIPWQVEVFTLSSGSWRILSINLRRQSCALRRNQVVIDGFIYWSAIDRVDSRNHQWYYLIILFDLKMEEFSEVYLPDSLANDHDISLSISKLKESCCA